MDYYPGEKLDSNAPDYKGTPILKPHKGKVFVGIAVEHVLLSLASVAENYRKSMDKMRKKLVESGFS